MPHLLRQGNVEMLGTGEPMEGQQVANYGEIRNFIGGRPLPIFFNGKNLHASISLLLERLCNFVTLNPTNLL